MTDELSIRWPEGYDAAVSLTYDGGLIDHLELAIPRLNQLGLKGTFYVDGPALLENLDTWRTALSQGHEIGNGALLDPLNGPEDDAYLEETFLECFQGGSKSSASYGSELTPDRLVRGRLDGLNYPSKLQPHNLRHVVTDDLKVTDLIRLTQAARREQAWLILTFRGIGTGDHGLDRADHDGYLSWLATNESNVWVAPVIEVARYSCALEPPRARLL